MKKLMAYLSVQGRTKGMVKELKEDFDVFEIVPEQAYTLEDIDYTKPEARCTMEWKSNCDVAYVGKVENFDEYDTVCIGFPIWYGAAPNVVHTFCKDYDWNGKNVIVFATCGGSPITGAEKKIKEYIDGANVLKAQIVHNSEELAELVK